MKRKYQYYLIDNIWKERIPIFTNYWQY